MAKVNTRNYTGEEMGTAWTKSYFDKVFRNPDPWYFASSEYEQKKYQRQIEAVEKHLTKMPQKILELGCAEGVHTRLIATAFPSAKVIAVDISSRAIERAKVNSKNYPNVSYTEADIFDFIQTTNTKKFDVVFFSETIYYLGDRFPMTHLFTFLQKLVGKMKRDGILCMTNIIGQQNAPESSLTYRETMNFYYTMISSLVTPVKRKTYREVKETSKKTYEYQLWLFQK